MANQGMANRKIPTTVISGFLGAGKTSLIRHVLATANGRRVALIINEFGDLGIDESLLRGCGDDACADGDIVELANGCICCTVADDFVPTIEALLARDPAPEHIVIETSGLALPKPLVAAFNWPEIRNRVTVDGVVAVVDGPAVLDGRFAADPAALQAQREADEALDHESPLEEVFEDQLACADLVVLNKVDLLDADERARTRALLAGDLRAGVKIVEAEQARIDADVLLGLAAAAEDDLAARPSHHDEFDGEHDHDEFDSFVLSLGPVADPLPYLYRMANNLMLDRYRSSTRRERREQDWAGGAGGVMADPTDDVPVDDRLILTQQLDEARSVLRALGPRVELVFRRFRIEGVGQKVIADELGVSLTTVEKDLQKAYRAMIALKQKMDTE